ncbi:MAG: DUF1080 domain-containing protein [Opitutales bacterium]|nr:DUF1080 domain-containing protein [Opitutales bacterium]
MTHRPSNSPSLAWFTVAFVSILFLGTSAVGQEYKSLFNGKDLSGWEGSSKLWKVEDGQIVGTTIGNPLEANTFLIAEDVNVSDFHLKLKLRMTGESNSGIMYRAQTLEGGPFRLKGPQMDIHPKHEYQGMYYSEQTGRGIVAQRGQKVLIPADLNAKGKTTPQVRGDLGKDPAFDLSEWITYEIIATGRRSVHKMNGVVTVDVVDRDTSTILNGMIGLQLHRGPDMTIFVKDVELRQKLNAKDAKALIEKKK